MLSVVIIDDDEIFSEALADKLSTQAVSTERFTAANVFLEESDPNRFDLAIIDLTMADSRGVYWEFAGVDVVRAIRRTAGENIPIWVLTGNNMPHMLKACLDNGANDFLSKDEGVAGICRKITSLAPRRATH